MDAPQIDPWWLVHAKLAFAALCGGFLRLLFKPATSLLKMGWMLCGCVTCGYFGTPAIMAWWDIGPDFSGAVGALTGFVGLSFAEGLLKALDSIDLKAWLLRIMTRGNEA
jgi:hypothetical protein